MNLEPKLREMCVHYVPTFSTNVLYWDNCFRHDEGVYNNNKQELLDKTVLILKLALVLLRDKH